MTTDRRAKSAMEEDKTGCIVGIVMYSLLGVMMLGIIGWFVYVFNM